jgi:hypothetical protein
LQPSYVSSRLQELTSCVLSRHVLVSNFAITLQLTSFRLRLKDTTFLRLLPSRDFFATLRKTSHNVPRSLHTLRMRPHAVHRTRTLSLLLHRREQVPQGTARNDSALP